MLPQRIEMATVLADGERGSRAAGRVAIGATAAAILVPFVAGVVYNALVALQRQSGLNSTSPNFPGLLRTMVMGLAMIAGIFVSLIAEHVSARPKNRRVSFRDMFRRVSTHRDLVLALCLAPSIFYILYYEVRSEPDNVLAVLHSFQNGFFWHTVIHKTRE